MIFTPKDEIQKRTQGLQKSLYDSGIGGALIYQNVDVFYYTGTLQNGALYVPAIGDPIFMVIKNIDRAQVESSIEKIVPLANPVKVGEILTQNNYKIPAKVGLEMDVIPARLFDKLKSVLNCEIVDISMNVRIQRSIKSEFEITMMQNAAKIVKKAFTEIPNILEEGITETEASAQIEYILRKNGHQGVVRMRAFGMELYAAHLAFGSSSASPVHFDGPVGLKGLYPGAPQIGGSAKLKPGVPVMADIVAGYNGYMVDCTRSYALKSIDAKYLKMHEATMKLNKAIIKQMKPGAIPADIYAATLQMAKDMGYEHSFMASGHNQVKFVAHGIGLEVDEIPVIASSFRTPFVAGTTMAVEPKIIEAGKGGAGIENTYLITDSGAKNLTGFDMELKIV